MDNFVKLNFVKLIVDEIISKLIFVLFLYFTKTFIIMTTEYFANRP